MASNPGESENISTPILEVPPEIFDLIASQLPLRLLPATLGALALTCKNIYSYVNPVLYSRVIIKNEYHASRLLERISEDPQLGRLIQELHLLIDLITEMRKQKRTSAVVKLQEVIEQGCLPQLSFFRLVLLKSSYSPDQDIELNFEAKYHFPRTFWATLKKCCPLLRGLCVDGVGDTSGDPWVNDPYFYDLEDFSDLNTLSIRSRDWLPSEGCLQRLCENITNLASSLQSLTLVFKLSKLYDAAPLLSITLPHLISFSISGFDLKKTEAAMDFWRRHPNLEQISINANNHNRWFSDYVDTGFLPKLTHLMGHYEDIRAMASHLKQLKYSCITYRYDCQVPYLLRSVISEGLPNFKSLEVHQYPCNDDFIPTIPTIGGATWYETQNGEFLEETDLTKAEKSVDGSYIYSIVRGAPSIEELFPHI